MSFIECITLMVSHLYLKWMSIFHWVYFSVKWNNFDSNITVHHNITTTLHCIASYWFSSLLHWLCHIHIQFHWNNNKTSQHHSISCATSTCTSLWRTTQWFTAEVPHDNTQNDFIPLGIYETELYWISQWNTQKHQLAVAKQLIISFDLKSQL